MVRLFVLLNSHYSRKTDAILGVTRITLPELLITSRETKISLAESLKEVIRRVKADCVNGETEIRRKDAQATLDAWIKLIQLRIRSINKMIAWAKRAKPGDWFAQECLGMGTDHIYFCVNDLNAATVSDRYYKPKVTALEGLPI